MEQIVVVLGYGYPFSDADRSYTIRMKDLKSFESLPRVIRDMPKDQNLLDFLVENKICVLFESQQCSQKFNEILAQRSDSGFEPIFFMRNFFDV